MTVPHCHRQGKPFLSDILELPVLIWEVFYIKISNPTMLKSFVGSFDNTLVSAIISSNTMNCYSIGMLFYLMAYMTLYPGCLP